MSDENLRLLGIIASIASILGLTIALILLPYKKIQNFITENFEVMGPLLLIIIFILLLSIGYLIICYILKHKESKGAATRNKFNDNMEKCNGSLERCNQNIAFLRKTFSIQTEDELKNNENKISKLLEEEKRAKKIYVISSDLKFDLKSEDKFRDIIHENLKEWFVKFKHDSKYECKYTYFIPKNGNLINNYIKRYFTGGYQIIDKCSTEIKRNADEMFLNEIADNLFVEIDDGFFQIFGTSPERSYYEFSTNEEPKFYNFKMQNNTLVNVQEIITDKDFDLIFRKIREKVNNPFNSSDELLRTDKIAHRFEKKAREIRILTPDLHIDLYHPIISKVVKYNHNKQKEKIKIEDGKIIDLRDVKYYYLMPKDKEQELIDEFSTVMEFNKALCKDMNYLKAVFKTIDNKDILKIGILSEIAHYTFENFKDGSENRNSIAVIFPPTTKTKFSDFVTIGGDIFRSNFLKHFDELWNQSKSNFL